jgi:hypothetical protein
LAVLGFELRVSHLQGRCCTTFTPVNFGDRVLIFAQTSLDCGVWTRGLHLEPLSALFCDGFFKMGSRELFCLGWLWTSLFKLSYIPGMTGGGHYAQIMVEMGSC